MTPGGQRVRQEKEGFTEGKEGTPVGKILFREGCFKKEKLYRRREVTTGGRKILRTERECSGRMEGDPERRCVLQLLKIVGFCGGKWGRGCSRKEGTPRGYEYSGR